MPAPSSPRYSGNRTVVCGLPGSGKSTYVEQHRKPGHFVWDFDSVRQAVFSHGHEADFTKDEQAILVAMLNGAAEAIAGTNVPAWIIVTDHEWAERIAKLMGGGAVIPMQTDAAECERRILARDPDGPDRERRLAMIQNAR